MAEERRKKKEPKKPVDLATDFTKMQISLAEAITQWAQMEATAAEVLSVAINTPLLCGTDIYFSAVAAETRFAILDVVIVAFAARNGQLSEFAKLWQETLATLSAAKSVRNKLAHGQIIRLSQGKTPTVRLVEANPQGLMKTPARNQPRQLPGLSLHDVCTATDRFLACTSSLWLLYEIIKLTWSRPRDIATLQERCHELEVHLKTGSAQIGGLPRLGL